MVDIVADLTFFFFLPDEDEGEDVCEGDALILNFFQLIRCIAALYSIW